MSKSRTKASTLPYLVRSHYLILGVIGATGYITDLYITYRYVGAISQLKLVYKQIHVHI